LKWTRKPRWQKEKRRKHEDSAGAENRRREAWSHSFSFSFEISYNIASVVGNSAIKEIHLSIIKYIDSNEHRVPAPWQEEEKEEEEEIQYRRHQGPAAAGIPVGE
jgi:hypothetical protein